MSNGERPSRIATALLVVGLVASAGLALAALLRGAHFGPYVAGRWLVVGGVGAAYHALALVGPRAWRPGFAVVTVTIVAALYAFEIAVTYDFVEPDAAQDRAEAAWRDAQPNYDRRMKLQVIEDLRAAGEDAWPDIGQATLFGGFEIDGERVVPISGVATATTVYCNESGLRTVYVADAHGFNNPPGLYDGPADVVIVGDSFAHGACVRPGEDVASQLRRLRPDDRVLTLGYGGAGPFTVLGQLEEYAKRLRPKDVFWMYYSANDLIDAKIELESDVLVRYLEDPTFSQGLWDLRPRFDPMLREFIDAKEAEARARGGFHKPPPPLGPTLKLQRVRTLFGLKPMPDPQTIFARAAASAKRRVDAWGGRLHFVYVWNWPHEPDGGPYRKSEVLEIVRGLGVDVIDTSTLFGDDASPFYPTPTGGHLSARGYRRLAEAMNERLTETSTAP